jgi:hypothetical protein
MRRIAELVGQSLKWEQPSALKMNYELRTGGGELAALLHFRSSFGSFATTETADGCWTFKRIGFFQTKVTIRACGSDRDIGIFKNNTWSGGGTLELADGGTFRAATNFWQTKFGFETESGEKLIGFEKGGLLHLSATVEIQPNAVSMAELPLMVTLGCYLIVMMDMDATTATTVVAG